MKLPFMIIMTPLALGATQAMAQPAPRMLISNVEPMALDSIRVEITVLNPALQPKTNNLPDRISAELTIDDRRLPVMLKRSNPSSAQEIEPRGFVQAQYLMSLPAGSRSRKSVILSLMDAGASGYAFALPDTASPMITTPDTTQPAVAGPIPVGPPVGPASNQPPSAKPDHGNAFLGNLSSYAPIYAVYGPGTNSDGRVQISFKYQLFGDPGAVGGGNPLINGIHFAYTQRLFWDLGAHSSPFRNIDYMPEIFYLLPAAPVGKQIALGGQAGFRHESNGRDGLASRSLNTVYIQPVATMPVGKYTLSLGPRLSFYAGNLADNPDIKRYRGNTSLFAEIGEDDGLRLTTNSRFNFSSGKGAIDAELSYPLDRIVNSNLNLYIFGQGFAGYGENLLDYDRKITRLRIGIGIVR